MNLSVGDCKHIDSTELRRCFNAADGLLRGDGVVLAAIKALLEQAFIAGRRQAMSDVSRALGPLERETP